MRPIRHLALIAAAGFVVGLAPPAGADHSAELSGTFNTDRESHACRTAGDVLKCRIKVPLAVRNDGVVRSANARLEFYLLGVDDTAVDGDAVLLQTISLGSVRPGRTKTKTFSTKLPDNVQVEGRTYAVKIDASNTVVEHNEDDNQPTLAIPVSD